MKLFFVFSGIAWTSLQAVITYATSNPGTVSGLVKNEVMHTDVCTGEKKPCILNKYYIF